MIKLDQTWSNLLFIFDYWKTWLKLVMLVVFMWFARFQILLCEPQSIWRKLHILNWLYKTHSILDKIPKLAQIFSMSTNIASKPRNSLNAPSNIDGPVALLLLTVQNIKPAPKTFTENWDSKAPSVGTLLAYLETTA